MDDHVYRKLGRSGVPDRKTADQLMNFDMFGVEAAFLQLIDIEDLQRGLRKIHPEDGRYERSIEICKKLRSEFKTNPLPTESARFERMMKILTFQEGEGRAEALAYAGATLAFHRGEGEWPGEGPYGDIGKVFMAFLSYRQEIGFSKFPESPGKYLSDLIDIASQESDRIADQLKD